MFEVTDDISDLTCADLFSEVGKKTPVLVRFSTVGGEKGSADTARDPRGFAVKFFTDEGNWDLVSPHTDPARLSSANIGDVGDEQHSCVLPSRSLQISSFHSYSKT